MIHSLPSLRPVAVIPYKPLCDLRYANTHVDTEHNMRSLYFNVSFHQVVRNWYVIGSSEYYISFQTFEVHETSTNIKSICKSETFIHLLTVFSHLTLCIRTCAPQMVCIKLNKTSDMYVL